MEMEARSLVREVGWSWFERGCGRALPGRRGPLPLLCALQTLRSAQVAPAGAREADPTSTLPL